MLSQFESKQNMNVGPKERMASLIGGAGLVLLSAVRPSKASGAMALSGGYLIYRGLTGNCPVYETMGIDRTGAGGMQGIQVQRAVTINRPRAEVYRYWRNFENLANFMGHIERVDVIDNRRSHWVAKAPLDQEVSWDGEITEERENELIAWRSLPGSQIENSGVVRFRDAAGDRGTVVDLSLWYEPPAGSLGAAFARLLGEEPSVQAREDLRHFKAILEAGEVPTVTGQTSGRVEGVDAERIEISHRRQKDVVQTASEQSFPASDPPSWTETRSLG